MISFFHALSPKKQLLIYFAFLFLFIGLGYSILVYKKSQPPLVLKPIPLPTHTVVSPTPTWNAYTYRGGTFSLEYPSSWKVSDGLMQGGGSGVAFTGIEGNVSILEDRTFGKSCGQTLEQVQLKDHTVFGCILTNPNGSMEWDQYAFTNASGKKYGIQAVASPSASLNKNLILQILSTLSFH